MAAKSFSFSLGGRPCLLVAAVLGFFFFFFCLPTTTTARPMTEVVEEAMMRARMEQQEADHSRQPSEGHRQKRAVTRTDCTRPDNLNAMFEQINAGMNMTGFLGRLHGDQSISIPAGEAPEYVDEDPNETKTCPSQLTTYGGAPLAHRSLCPFYYRTMLLPDGYFPVSLRTTRCKCTKCVQNTGYGCEAIFRKVAVLKPVGCFQGLQRYQEQQVEVQTGCVCATPADNAAAAPTTTTTKSPFVQ